jgi:TolB-like protein/AraC-like DNA-binding protein
MITTDKLFVEKLNRLIDDNLDNPALTVDLICQKLAVSRSQLHRIIKEQTGLSTSLYIRKCRLLKAKELLNTSDLRISEIGDRVGITNPQNFSAYFINEFKISPTDFRKLNGPTLLPVAETLPLSEVPLQVVAPQQLVRHEPDESSPRRPALSPRRRLIYAGAVLGLLLILGTGLAIWYQNRSANRSASPVESSLAVLPFVNLGDTDSSPACEGIMDDIHTSVSLIKTLKVISRSSSDQYKDSKKSIWQIGDELQVANVLKGSVLKAGDQLQVKVEIINTKEDIRLWGHTYRAAYSEFFSLTDQIVRDVAERLDQKPRQSQTAKLKRLPTRNLAAYQEYIKGKQFSCC